MFIVEHPIYLGLLVTLVATAFGVRDLLRFGLRRVNAIAGVCFAESIRRRVLWIIPLAIVGVIVVAQWQKAADDQDAIRQTTKYCLFATGLIVTITGMILAATNLPKEIESRVIYTIVTKPTTRFEIVLGKVMGFSAVSAVILLIMGLFTWGYLQVRAARIMGDVRARLASGQLDAPSRATLEHYQRVGLLSVKSLDWPTDFEVVSKIPDQDDVRWITGARAQYFSAPFSLTEDQRHAIEPAVDGQVAAAIIVTLQVQKHPPSTEEASELAQGKFPREFDRNPLIIGPAAPTTGPATLPAPERPLIPQIAVQIVDPDGHSLGGKEISVQNNLPPPGPGIKFSNPMIVHVPLPPDALESMLKATDSKFESAFSVEVQAQTPTIDYRVDPGATEIVIYNEHAVLTRINSCEWGHPGTPGIPRTYARVFRSGMQVRGQADGNGAIGMFRFEHVSLPRARNGKISLQVKLNMERGGDLDASRFATSQVSVEVRNRATGVLFAPVILEPETGRADYLDMPAEAFEGGSFDVLVKGLTPGQTLALQGPAAAAPSIALAAADHSFAGNLIKSLFILWLLSVMVIILSVFCSTFLSWPIAIVLTVILLLSRWGADELGSALDPGASRSTASDIFGVRDPSGTTAVTESLEMLSKTLRTSVKLMPEVTRFSAFEDIERGVSIPWDKLDDALLETAGYGIPLILLTYLILKRKEVAP